MSISHTQIIERLLNAGYEAYYVGGFVRDFLLNITSQDVDVATNAPVEKMKEIFFDCHLNDQAKSFGCLVVEKVQITQYRQDDCYVNHRHPQKMTFVQDAYTDSLRRDFTCNALYMDLEKKILDFHNGRRDIENRLLVSVMDPFKSFEQDALRMLRAIRMAVCFSFELDETLRKALYNQAYLLSYLNKNALKKEMNRLITLENASQVLAYFHEFDMDYHIYGKRIDQLYLYKIK